MSEEVTDQVKSLLTKKISEAVKAFYVHAYAATAALPNNHDIALAEATLAQAWATRGQTLIEMIDRRS